MKKFILALLLVLGISSGVQASGGDAQDFKQLQRVEVFFNNSGGELSAGDVVILDVSGSGVSAGTTLGAYVTTVSGADSVLVVGVVKSTLVADQRPVAVVVEGPIDTKCQDASDAVTASTAVGTTTSVGSCGGGTNLGFSLEAGAGTDGDYLTVWVAPTGGD